MTEETTENTTNVESDSSLESYTKVVSLPKTADKIAKPSFNLSGKHYLTFKSVCRPFFTPIFFAFSSMITHQINV